MDYDIIGDIHGQFDKLEALLFRLGYQARQGVWRHPRRQAIFVGDFIDRGPQGVETVQTVRAMVDAGAALAVMGNHELNAIAWHTPDLRDPGEYLRPRSSPPWGAKNRTQHQAFLAQVEPNPELHADLIAWFLTLPLWLDLDELRVVHACWHGPYIAWLAPQLRDGRFLTQDMLVDATTEPADLAEKDNALPSVFKAVEAITKGIEIPIPAFNRFNDKDGFSRERVRVRWWEPDAVTYRDFAMLPDSDRLTLPDMPIPDHARLVSTDNRPTFFGHYWMTGAPLLQSNKAVCVDYSAGKGGPLVAYRWNKGEPLSAANFVASA
jgi:hypothetical protein